MSKHNRQQYRPDESTDKQEAPPAQPTQPVQAKRTTRTRYTINPAGRRRYID